MKAHKYLMPLLVISAVYAAPEYDGNPRFFTVTSHLVGISTLVFPSKSLKMTENSIQIQVQLDENKMPAEISWSAPNNNPENTRKAKAFLLSLWDGSDKAALRIDLWTKDMMVDEMEDFFYQTLMTMADTYKRATLHDDLAVEMKSFAKTFFQKSRSKQLNINKL